MRGVVTRTQALKDPCFTLISGHWGFFCPESSTFGPLLTASCRKWKVTKSEEEEATTLGGYRFGKRIDSLCDVTMGWFLKRFIALSQGRCDQRCTI